MPDQGASRKRQMQVTPGPFGGVAAAGPVPNANCACGEGAHRRFG